MAAVGGGAGAGGAGAIVPIFTRFPGEYVDPLAPNFIDWSNDREVKTYKAAVVGLDEKFDLSPSKLHSFLNRVQERVTVYNWNVVVNIAFPVPAAAAAPAPIARPPINLITNYGQVTLEEVRAHAEVYMAVNTRPNQQSGMLYLFLSNSLDTDAHNLMDINPQNYTINGLKDGACFLKEIITKAYVDTNATVDTIRKSISRLDEKI
jgi:hypothetical protein